MYDAYLHLIRKLLCTKTTVLLNVSLPACVSLWSLKTLWVRTSQRIFLIIHFSDETGKDTSATISKLSEECTAPRKPEQLQQTADMHSNQISHLDIYLFIHVRIHQTSKLLFF